MTSAALAKLDPNTTAGATEGWAWQLNKQTTLEALPVRMGRSRGNPQEKEDTRSSSLLFQLADTAFAQSARTPAPVVALLEALDPAPVVRSNAHFRSDQEWQGFVTDVDASSFHAVAVPTLKGCGQSETSLLRIELERLSKSEQAYVSVGAQFVLCLGVQIEWITNAKGITRKSVKPRLRIYFRRYSCEPDRVVREIRDGIERLASLPQD